LLNGSPAAQTNRADKTPLILGICGSQLDLIMNALYFSDDRADPVTMAETETIWESGLGLPIPINTAFETNGARIVGTALECFDFRGLNVAESRQIALLGEAILDAGVANRLGLGPGDTVVSAPQNLFDLDGVYPLELNIVGVLAPTGTADDEAVFVDIKTSWVIAGIGHGQDGVLAQGATNGDIVASPSIVEFNRTTDANINSFHFHGDSADDPVSAIILAPQRARAATILRGRYLDPANPVQMTVPREVIAGLVDRIFRIKTLRDAVTLIVGGAALAAVGLAVFLTYRLRARDADRFQDRRAAQHDPAPACRGDRHNSSVFRVHCTRNHRGRATSRQRHRGVASGRPDGKHGVGALRHDHPQRSDDQPARWQVRSV
jgi:putative ABC transport system permease protein